MESMLKACGERNPVLPDVQFAPGKGWTLISGAVFRPT